MCESVVESRRSASNLAACAVQKPSSLLKTKELWRSLEGTIINVLGLPGLNKFDTKDGQRSNIRRTTIALAEQAERRRIYASDAAPAGAAPVSASGTPK